MFKRAATSIGNFKENEYNELLRYEFLVLLIHKLIDFFTETTWLSCKRSLARRSSFSEKNPLWWDQFLSINDRFSNQQISQCHKQDTKIVIFHNYQLHSCREILQIRTRNSLICCCQCIAARNDMLTKCKVRSISGWLHCLWSVRIGILRNSLG